MLTRDEVIKQLQAHRKELETFGVKSISVFGSVAREEAGPQSDVDLLVDLEDGVTLFGLTRLQRRLEKILGVPVDLATEDALRDQIRDTVLAEAVRAA